MTYNRETAVTLFDFSVHDMIVSDALKGCGFRDIKCLRVVLDGERERWLKYLLDEQPDLAVIHRETGNRLHSYSHKTRSFAHDLVDLANGYKGILLVATHITPGDLPPVESEEIIKNHRADVMYMTSPPSTAIPRRLEGIAAGYRHREIYRRR
ncbi:hypothetical protein HYT55_04025 [Candidatus Woesearchaeota archaeon]|nr:hypothetical protein [Candidatus Woesearchaeota archaeon]